MTTDVLVNLRRLVPRLRPAEARIAEAVLADPRVAIDSTITEVAKACDTSPATVARFVAAAGFAGYPEFRLAVARAADREHVEQSRFRIDDSDIDPRDSVDDVVSKIAYLEARTIEETAAGLDRVALDRVADAVIAAPRIDIYGVASSGLAGQDLQQKLHRIGLFATCWTDPHLALTSAAVLTPGSLAIGFSHSGLTVEVHDALEVARASGATTVVVTNFPDAPMVDQADLVLATTARETRFRSGAMASRIAQLAVVDFLFVRVAQRRYAETGDSLARTYDAVQKHRLDYEGRPRP